MHPKNGRQPAKLGCGCQEGGCCMEPRVNFWEELLGGGPGLGNPATEIPPTLLPPPPCAMKTLVQ